MNAVNVNIDDFYRNEVDCLGIDAKKRLVALLNASLSLHEKLSKEKYLLNKVAGAWKDDESAEDTIARIVSSRTNKHKLIMVTENVRHLSRLPGIIVENWAS